MAKNIIKTFKDFAKSFMRLNTNIRIFHYVYNDISNREKRKRPDIEDMVWAIKMLAMSEKEIERMVNNFRDAVLEYNK